MKKLDKLILKAFIGPFFLTFVVVVFILLTQSMMKYFDEFVGKDLGAAVFAELLMYFSINMTPVALPLAVLLSSLMTFGNLGEHFELTAIKSAGLSLTRALQPIFVFTILLTFAAFLSNNYIVPKANLKAYSLLYDIRQKKPSLDLKEGTFYNGIPGYSIKVNQKLNDGESLKELIIYNHTDRMGNVEVILADSGKMYTFHNDRYLMLEMFNGNSYTQSIDRNNRGNQANIDPYVRNKFSESKYIFSLASFDMQRTDEDLFSTNRLMKNIGQLNADIDSMRAEVTNTNYGIYAGANRYYSYHLKDEVRIPEQLENEFDVVRKKHDISVEDSVSTINIAEQRKRNRLTQAITRTKTDSIRQLARNSRIDPDSAQLAQLESFFNKSDKKRTAYSQALSQARFIKNNIMVQSNNLKNVSHEINVHDNERHKKVSMAVACLVMFLIGAPLGSIIKKGGLGIPVIISIIFFIIFYVLSIIGEKWGKEGLVPPVYGVWAANLFLLPFGLFFLKQARKDARIFESDVYSVWLDKFKNFLAEKKQKKVKEDIEDKEDKQKPTFA